MKDHTVHIYIDKCGCVHAWSLYTAVVNHLRMEMVVPATAAM